MQHHAGPGPDLASGRRRPRATAVVLGSLPFVLYLAVLVHLRKPLPVDDLTTAGMIGVGFALASLLALVAGLRLAVFSFPVLVAAGTSLFTMSVFVVEAVEGERLAFADYQVMHEDALEQGIPVVMLALAAFALGAALSRSKGRPPRPERIEAPHPAVDATRRTALVVYWTTAAAVLVASLSGPGVFQSIYHGYTGGSGFQDMRKLGQVSNVVTTGINWFLPWASYILLATSRNRGEFTRSTLFAVATCLLNLQMGDRGTTLVTIPIWIQIRYLLGYPVRWRRLAILGALAAAIVVVWPFIRTVPVRDWRPGVLGEVLEERFAGDFDSEHVTVAGHLLHDMTPRYMPVMVSCHYVPEIEPFRLGADYLFSALSAVPFTARHLSPYFPEPPLPWMMRKIDPNFWTGRNFNQVAEAYLQGGAVAVIPLYVLLGWYLTWIWGRLRGEADLRLTAFHCLAVVAAYRWTGNASLGVGRTLLWAAVLVYVLPAIYRWLTARRDGSAAVEPPARGGAG